MHSKCHISCFIKPFNTISHVILRTKLQIWVARKTALKRAYNWLKKHTQNIVIEISTARDFKGQIRQIFVKIFTDIILS